LRWIDHIDFAATALLATLARTPVLAFLVGKRRACRVDRASGRAADTGAQTSSAAGRMEDQENAEANPRRRDMGNPIADETGPDRTTLRAMRAESMHDFAA
jgi:hypothetical protein